METLFYLCVPAAKHIVVSGDIHGEFNTLVYKLCVQYKMRDTLLIVAGDCGFGFEKPEYYRSIVRKNSKRMSLANNWIVFVRGNHDNPAYFNGNVFAYKRFIAVPDYSVIQACNKTILGVGGESQLIGYPGKKSGSCIITDTGNSFIFPTIPLLPEISIGMMNLPCMIKHCLKLSERSIPLIQLYLILHHRSAKRFQKVWLNILPNLIQLC